MTKKDVRESYSIVNVCKCIIYDTIKFQGLMCSRTVHLALGTPLMLGYIFLRQLLANLLSGSIYRCHWITSPIIMIKASGISILSPVIFMGVGTEKLHYSFTSTCHVRDTHIHSKVY